ncbi:MAG: phosphotransferase [Novosphingobium sp.]|nr:phosphotransferase [Novosphingobium sp.]
MSSQAKAPSQPKIAVPATAAEALDPAWLSQALSEVSGGKAVTSVEQVEYLKTMATKIRFAVTYEGSDEKHAYCVKGLLDIDEGNAGLGSTCVAEADFYCKLAPQMQVRVPECLVAVIDREAQNATIIMRDVIDQGGTFCSALETFTADDAASSLSQLAALHASQGLLKTETWIEPRAAQIARMPAFTGELIQPLMDDPRGDNLTPEVRSGDNILAAMRAFADLSDNRPQFLLHGDSHAGNIFRTSEGLGLIDWQVIQHGGWALDVAYHLNAVLPTEIAEKEERRLVNDYLARMRASGVDMPNDEDAWTQYREGVAYGLFMWAITRRVDPPIIYRFTDRLGKAAMRHDTFKLLGVV